MTTFKHEHRRRGGAWTARMAAVLGLGVVVAAAACGRNAASVTSPSGAAPTSLRSVPGVQKYFTAGITTTPTPVPANTSGVVLHVTITDCGAATSGCTSGASDSDMGSAEIVVPSGLTVTGVGNFAGSQSWGTTWTSGQTVDVGALAPNAGQKKLTPGQSVTFDITVTTSVCNTYIFDNPKASNSTLADNPTFGTDWQFFGNTLSVAVTANCSTTDCPAAPSIAAHYLDFDLNIHPGSNLYDNIVSQVAQHMTQGAYFDGIGPCEEGYAAAVTAFVDAIVATL